MNANEITRKQARTERIGLSVTKEQKRLLKRAARQARCSMAELLQPDIDRCIALLVAGASTNSQPRP